MELWGWYKSKSRSAIQTCLKWGPEQGTIPIDSTPDVMDTAFLEQQGLCALCSERNEFTNGLHADHCHETGRFRGWLCAQCNVGLGYMYEFPLRPRKIECGHNEPAFYPRFFTVKPEKILDYLEPFVPTLDEKWYPHVINVHLEITY